ncbi:MAG: M20/M25/M40 family metallo-hydrolase [Candidatus Heimdallarchaeaceae archaeon]|jgi:putative aminopeptidase FrvX
MQSKKLGNNTYKNIIDLFSELLAIPSPSGMENALADFIIEKCTNLGYRPQKDQTGNVFVRIEGKNRQETCCLAAHMDEIGLMVTKINPDGSLKIERVGGSIPWKYGERPVTIYGENKIITGIIALGSGHAAGSSQGVTDWKNVKVVTGLNPETLEKEGIKPGTLITILDSERGPIILGEESKPMIASWTFDDKMGIVTLIQLLEAIMEQNFKPNIDLIIAFTTTEEIGCFGAKYLAQELKPTYFIAVDGCPFASESPMVLDLPGIRIRDRTFFYSKELIKALSQSALDAGTELQQLVYTLSGSDAGYVGNIGASPHTACVGHIRLNSHGYEIAYLSVFEKLYKTLWSFITTFKGIE